MSAVHGGLEASKRVVRTEISRMDDLNRRKAGAGHDRPSRVESAQELKIGKLTH